jgi:hypothetical protein
VAKLLSVVEVWRCDGCEATTCLRYKDFEPGDRTVEFPDRLSAIRAGWRPYARSRRIPSMRRFVCPKCEPPEVLPPAASEALELERLPE